MKRQADLYFPARYSPGLLFLLLTGLFFDTESRADGEKMSYLENGDLRVGVDLMLGGAITWLSGPDGANRVNNFDHGRQIQLSYFSGPVPFETANQKPATHWSHIGWNPIQAGDDFHHGSELIEHRNNGKELYVKCIPLQWPLNAVPGECFFESWLTLEGPVVKARARVTLARADKTQYPARLQELPALYTNAAYHRLMTYSGAHPRTGAVAETLPASQTKHPWTFWQGTEHWSALLNEQDEGLGLITPGRSWFTGGFAGRPGPNDTHATDTGYLAGQALEILDHNGIHEFRYEVVVGSLEQIRARAATHRTTDLPAWRFTGDRQGWHYRDAHDTGWPIMGMLDVVPDGADPQIISPIAFWEAESASELVIEAAFGTGGTAATLYWRRFGEEGPGDEDHTSFTVPDDGAFHRVVVPLGDCPGYHGPIVQLRLDPLPQGKVGARVRVKSITLSRGEP